MINVQNIVSQFSTMFDAARDSHDAGQAPTTLEFIVTGISENSGADYALCYQIGKKVAAKRSDIVLVKGRNGGVCSVKRQQWLAGEKAKMTALAAKEREQREADRKAREAKAAERAIKREARLAKVDVLAQVDDLLAG